MCVWCGCSRREINGPPLGVRRGIVVCVCVCVCVAASRRPSRNRPSSSGLDWFARCGGFSALARSTGRLSASVEVLLCVRACGRPSTPVEELMPSAPVEERDHSFPSRYPDHSFPTRAHPRTQAAGRRACGGPATPSSEFERRASPPSARNSRSSLSTFSGSFLGPPSAPRANSFFGGRVWTSLSVWKSPQVTQVIYSGEKHRADTLRTAPGSPRR